MTHEVFSSNKNNRYLTMSKKKLFIVHIVFTFFHINEWMNP